MKANELRIGNWYDHNGVQKQVTPNTIEEVWVAERTWCKPIPLTKKWCLNLGFEVFEGKISYDRDKLSIYFGDTILSGNNGRTYWNGCSILEESPKYVHQLQNLYFALSGEELTLQSD